MNFAFLISVVAPLVLLFFLVVRPQFTVKAQLKEWAAANGFMITHADRHILLTGPFPESRRRGIVYKFEVQTLEGQRRTGWIKLGYSAFRREAWSKRVVRDDR